MYYSGFADEASPELDGQIEVTKALGWKHIETRILCGGNLASIDEAKFEAVCAKLAAAGVAFNSYGSGIANWASPITDPPEKGYEEMRRALPRMRRLGIGMIRIMSYQIAPELYPRNEEFFPEVVKRLKTVVAMAADAGVLCVHENCAGWGGLSWEHSRRLLEAVNSPALKLVFDTGNCVFHHDVRGAAPYRRQDSWEFYRQVRDHIAYIHIKDGYVDDQGKDVFTFCGEGKGAVREILRDLFARGYDGGISIEPHLGMVFHESDRATTKADECKRLYIEYGRRLMAIVDELKAPIRK